MKYQLGTYLIKLGHIVSMWGCRIRGHHAHLVPGFNSTYCMVCGRLYQR